MKKISDVREGVYEVMPTGDGSKSFDKFFEIKTLPTLSHNPSNWVLALRVTGGWIAVANGEILSIGGEYVFDSIVQIENQINFVCSVKDREWICSWYYGFNFCEKKS